MDAGLEGLILSEDLMLSEITSLMDIFSIKLYNSSSLGGANHISVLRYKIPYVLILLTF
ncbi:MAG: hypothetical protein ACFFDN_26695 [Candidatus Hodarchaeota archaeon]